jgi:signal transduction histidine kinase
MNSMGPAEAGSYELPLPAIRPQTPEATGTEGSRSLPEPFLVKNVLWFCRLRWVVVAMLTVFAICAWLPGLFQNLGLRSRVLWPLAAAAVLAVANAGFTAHARLLTVPDPPRHAKANLWAQIVLDLLVLTVVVHFLGSLETHAAFAYLFHVVLACIFLSRIESFGVVGIASCLYAGCVSLERAGVLASATVYADGTLRSSIERTPTVTLLNLTWAIGIWIVVWYLASQLSAMVRARDSELAQTNRLLAEAQRERTRHMLRTTHELKAPFAAIHANAQLLLRGHCGVLPDDALDIVRRIAERCRRLAAEIQEMLQLANLRSESEQPVQRARIDLADAMRWAIGQVRQGAKERHISIEEDLAPAFVRGAADHLKMLFENLLSNAVSYGRQGGAVRVHCSAATGDGPVVVIEDDGIGIAPQKLPHIFDEYYRTDEAAKHNKFATGLGLAIVKQVAEQHSVHLLVESTPDVGTRFTLRFAGTGENLSPSQSAERR